MKPTLKAPGFKRLKPEHENLLSNFALNFNLRHYSSAAQAKRDDGDGIDTQHGAKGGGGRV
jgi:hypothetical protein